MYIFCLSKRFLHHTHSLMREYNFLNNKISFCVVEDDESFRNTFTYMLEPHGEVKQISNYEDAIDYLKTTRPDMLFVDMHLNGKKDGPKIVEFASKKDIHCVVVSSCDDDLTINECINLGAKDYYVKGNEIALVKDIIAKYKKIYQKPTNSDFSFTTNKLYKKNLEFMLTNAKSEFPILLHGATGSGKTFLAKKIHMKSDVKGKFIAVNCSSIPRELFESEMFGHEKGAFSGADKAYKGKVLEANEGTLYLDEIDSMPLSQQAKLLKVLEDKEFYPVGSNNLKKSSFRLISSSQRNLKDLIQEGKFREDLYYRISFIETRVMPLKERIGDVIPILKTMLKGPRRYQFTDDCIKTIESYDWPGNLRELQIFASNITLSKESRVTDEIARNIINGEQERPYFLTQYQKRRFDELGFDKFISLVRSEIIQYCLEKNDGKVSSALDELGISSASFYRWKEVNLLEKENRK